MVSNKLINAILGCQGLIYVAGRYSSKSFWVAFERDYALRAGKPVFSFDPEQGRIEADTSEPLRLPIYPEFSYADNKRITRILQFMEKKRHFSPWKYDLMARGVYYPQQNKRIVEDHIAAGGYLLLFWSQGSAKSSWIQWSETEWRFAVSTFPDRVLLALLDDTPLEPEMSNTEVIQLFGDRERSESHRLDDLIVRLYWLIHRNTIGTTPA
jgi:hypothetical protein